MKNTAHFTHPKQMEPLLPKARASQLAELSREIFFQAGRVMGQLHSDGVRAEVARLIREMNCYYSNLIEGHKTRPGDIERALRQDFSSDPKQRDNQELSLAHIATEIQMRQRQKDEADLDVYSPEFIAWIHRTFYSYLPENLHCALTSTGSSYRVSPGGWRNFMVDVGRHTPPHFECVGSFMQRFASFYNTHDFLVTERLVAIASAHHRLGWIHPFGDGNGRVMRLHSHALLTHHGLDGGGLWTLSRGLARKRESYYHFLQIADQPRSGDLDGRGYLTDKGLADFCVFFLETLLDQINFMGDLLQLSALRLRVERAFLYEMSHLGKDSEPLMRVVRVLVDKGAIPRSEVQEITGKGATVSARLIKRGLEEGLFQSPSPKGNLRVYFGPTLQETLFPNLYLDLPVD